MKWILRRIKPVLLYTATELQTDRHPCHQSTPGRIPPSSDWRDTLTQTVAKQRHKRKRSTNSHGYTWVDGKRPKQNWIKTHSSCKETFDTKRLHVQSFFKAWWTKWKKISTIPINKLQVPCPIHQGKCYFVSNVWIGSQKFFAAHREAFSFGPPPHISWKSR